MRYRTGIVAEHSKEGDKTSICHVLLSYPCPKMELVDTSSFLAEIYYKLKPVYTYLPVIIQAPPLLVWAALINPLLKGSL